MDLAALSAAIDTLVEVAQLDPSSLGDGEVLVGLHRQLARLDYLATVSLGAFDAAQAFAVDGARGAAPWLATRCLLPRARARAELRRARALRHLPRFSVAWSEGALTGEHLSAAAGLRSEATRQALERDEALLVEQATRLRFEQFVTALSYFGQLADPDGAEARDEERRARRDVTLSESFEGTWLGKMTLDPVSGAIVSDELGRLEGELYEHDRAEARTRLGRDPLHHELCRTPSQRRADALVEMARRSASALPERREPAPLFSVLVGYETLHGRICELAGGTVLAPGTLLHWLSEALVERVVFESSSRVEVGPKVRLFNGATRRAIELRDRCCTHPYCDVPARRCQVDHIEPYCAGGPTDQDNGRLLCGFHNRLAHREWLAARRAPPEQERPPEQEGAHPPDGEPPGPEDETRPVEPLPGEPSPSPSPPEPLVD